MGGGYGLHSRRGSHVIVILGGRNEGLIKAIVPLSALCLKVVILGPHLTVGGKEDDNCGRIAWH